MLAKLKELAAKRMRFGYRRLTAMLVREGVLANHKRVYRLYRAEGCDADPTAPANTVDGCGEQPGSDQAKPALVDRFRQ